MSSSRSSRRRRTPLDDAARGSQLSLIERRPPEPITPGPESTDIPYSLGKSRIGRGRKRSENGWQQRKRLAVRLAVESLLFQVAPSYSDTQRLAAKTGSRGLTSATRPPAEQPRPHCSTR